MFNRRLVVFLVVLAGCILAALGRLAQLQLVRGGSYADAADQSLQTTRLLATARGDILDRNGRPLAVEAACFDLEMDYPAVLAVWAGLQARLATSVEGLALEEARRRVTDQIFAAGELVLLRRWLRAEALHLARRHGMAASEAEATLEHWTQVLLEDVENALDEAARIAELPREEVNDGIDRIVRRVWQVRAIVGDTVAEETGRHAVIRGFDQAVACVLRGELEGLRCLAVEPSTRRWYPHDELACHVIGLLGKVSKEDLDNDPHKGEALRQYLPDESRGISGVERRCKESLRGVRGRQVRHRSEGIISETPPVLGQEVRLTLDIELQRELTELLRSREENGAIVVLDVATGDVLALVSTPTYSLNSYATDFAALRDDQVNLPLLNRAVAGRYPPGSTVKPVAALAAAAEGLINAGTTIECQGYLHSPNRFRCWIYQRSRASHGALDLRQAIQHSCNIYFYKAGEWLSAERLGYWMRRFGLGAPSGTGLPEERGGRVPTRRWLWETQERVFTRGDGRLMAIGQGPVEATPIQVANVMAAIARGGVFLETRLIADEGPPHVPQDLKLPADALAAVQAGMHDVVNQAGGTGYPYGRHPTVAICGKTGTATTWPLRVDSNRNGRIDSHDRIVKTGAISWFAGYAPRDNPRIAFAILLEYAPAASGGQDCGPLAVELVQRCLARGYLE